MSDRDDQNNQDLVPYRIDDSVIAHSDAIQIVVPLEFPRSDRHRLRRQGINANGNSPLRFSIERSKLPLCSFRELDRVGHGSESEPQLGFHLLPGNRPFLLDLGESLPRL